MLITLLHSPILLRPRYYDCGRPGEVEGPHTGCAEGSSCASTPVHRQKRERDREDCA